VLAKTETALQRGFVRFMPQYLLELPIAIPDDSQRAELESLYKRAVEKGYGAVAPELDVAIYRVYGVTELEVSLIEGR